MNIAIIAGQDQSGSDFHQMMQAEVSRLLRNDIKVEYFTSVKEYAERLKEEWAIICLFESSPQVEEMINQICETAMMQKKIIRIHVPVTEEQVHSILRQTQKEAGLPVKIRLQCPDEKDILLDDIYYIHYKNRRCIIYQKNQAAYSCVLSQKDMAYALDIYDHFFWVNKSTVVNLRMIEIPNQEARILQIRNGHYVKVTAGRWQEFQKKYKNR